MITFYLDCAYFFFWKLRQLKKYFKYFFAIIREALFFPCKIFKLNSCLNKCNQMRSNLIIKKCRHWHFGWIANGAKIRRKIESKLDKSNNKFDFNMNQYDPICRITKNSIVPNVFDRCKQVRKKTHMDNSIEMFK